MRVQRWLRIPDDLPVRALMASVTLTDEQERPVARRSESLLLSAAAGSGKTSVLVERFVRAVREDGVAPAKVLAITFTDRAAGELRERVRARLLALGEREAARDAEGAFVGTFHGLCARMLRAHSLAAGLDPEFSILEEGLAGRLREQAFKAALRDFLAGEREQAVDLIAAYGVDRVRTMIESVHARLRSQGQRLPRLPAASVGAAADVPASEVGERGVEEVERDRAAAAACVLLDDLLAGFGVAYEALKRERGAVDFDDLELCAGELLGRRESIRVAWSQRFELLMVDEFQDTNPRQLQILRSLDHGNLFTVGDEHQSIYGFRHADVELFRARRAELSEQGASLALTSNFRSREPLLAVVNAVFEERFADFTPLVAAREEEDEGAERPDGEPLVELLLTDRGSGWSEHEDVAAEISRGLPPAALWRQAEARLLAWRVAELVQDGRARAGEVAVLLRAGGDLEVYERALQLRGLRTLAAAGGFWAHQQVGDLLAYLRTLANPFDEEAMYGVLASPLLGLSRDGLALVARAAREHGRGVWDVVCDPRADELLAQLPDDERARLLAFGERLREERTGVARRGISELIERAVEASGYREHVLGLDWGERRLANVHKLLRLARRFEASEGHDLRGFLDHVAHLRRESATSESDAPVEGVEPDAVRLMSIHAAKGLEFPVVCVADLGRAPNARQPDLLVKGDRVGLQLLRLDGEKSVAALDYEQLARERREAEAAEEDRILYVAMTRARERLLLSGAVDFERWAEQQGASTKRQGMSAISWLGPALDGELPERVREDALALAPVRELSVGGAGVRCIVNTPMTTERSPELPVDRVDPPSARSVSVARPALAARPAPAATGADRLPTASGADARAPGGDTTRAGDQPMAECKAALPSTLSYTSLAELERCGYRYYLERVLVLPENRAVARSEGQRGGLESRARGTLVHALLETLDFGRAEAPSPEQVSRRARELGMRLGAGEREEIAELIAGAIAAAPMARLAAASGVRREHPFAFSLSADGPLVTGVIDLLIHERDGGVVILDYKSDRVEPTFDLEALVEREYGVQRLLYSLAVLREGAERVEMVHWFLERPNEWIAAVYGADDREELEARLAALVASADARTFPVSAHPYKSLCQTCPGRGGLCSWPEQETLRDQPSG